LTNDTIIPKNKFADNDIFYLGRHVLPCELCSLRFHPTGSLNFRSSLSLPIILSGKLEPSVKGRWSTYPNLAKTVWTWSWSWKGTVLCFGGFFFPNQSFNGREWVGWWLLHSTCILATSSSSTKTRIFVTLMPCGRPFSAIGFNSKGNARFTTRVSCAHIVSILCNSHFPNFKSYTIFFGMFLRSWSGAIHIKLIEDGRATFKLPFGGTGPGDSNSQQMWENFYEIYLFEQMGGLFDTCSYKWIS
jgi:hypothetical protein